MRARGALRRVLSRWRAADCVGRCITFTPKMRLPTLWPWSMPSASSRKSSATTSPAAPHTTHRPQATATSTMRAPSRIHSEALG